MKKLYGVLSTILALCMILTILPVIPFAPAAEVVQRYELDTDGIDADGVYLIVSANSGNANALRRSNTSVAGQSVTVKTDTDGTQYIDIGFTNEANCKFVFGGSESGKVTSTNGNTTYALNINTNTAGTAVQFSRNGTQTCAFDNLGGGAYQISRSSSSRQYYLRYNNGWTRSSNNEPATVYLFKLTDHAVGCDVTYDGNGATEGTLPENGEKLAVGENYTVAAPTNLRKDVGEDSWLFYSWNTKADGSGDEYFPGDTITVSDNITLYAQWTPVLKYEVAMITYLNGVPTDVDVISGTDKKFYVQLQDGDGSYIELEKTAVGTYTTKVEQNGTYVVYSKVDGGDYEAVHGHKVVIYGQDGSTECMHYSITHDLNGGSWPQDFDYDDHPHHSGETHYAPTATPVLEGNRFLGWQDADGNIYQPGDLVTASVDKALVLTALWEKTVDVIVNVTIDHNSNDGGYDNSDEKDDVTFDVMRTDENGNNHLVGTITVTEDDHGEYVYTYSVNNGVTTYVMPEGKVTFGGLQKGNYTISLTKSHYEATYAIVTDAIGNTTIEVELKYAPSNFDLDFDVVIDDWANVPTHLRPTAVGVKVTYWGYNANGELGWHIITQQAGEKPPVSVAIDPETGKGTGFYPVWKFWADGENPYYYRVAVTSYVMADGTLVPASTEDYVDYVGGVCNGTVTIVPNGGLPGYPDDSDTDLKGTIYDSAADEQDSIPTVNVQVNPFTVTFDAADGTVNGQQTLVLNGQHLYPDLNNYVGVSMDGRTFVGWLDENGELATNMAGQLLDGNVTYTALYKENITISGNVQVDATYEQDGETIFVNEIDRVTEVQVVLQKKVGDTYNDVASYRAEITYTKGEAHGIGSYSFADLPDDGTQYRVTVLVLNYNADYDNNGDGTFADTEADALVNTQTAQAQVDAHLVFDPASYQQVVNVDSSQIHKDLRPTGAVVQILYRDLGDRYPYKVITQHTVDPYGIPITMTGAWGEGSDSVWNWHTDGTLYEYQAQVFKLYGNDVEGAYTKAGTEVVGNLDLPYTIKYGPANNYAVHSTTGGASLMATLVPKEYAVVLDLNLGDDPDSPVYGMEHFAVDNGQGGEYYAYMHTWSYADSFVATPYREGYVFEGWQIEDAEEDYVHADTTGVIHVGATLARSVTLKAKWRPMTGTDYTVRHLELNTDKVLKGATAVSGAMEGASVKAVEQVAEIEGYVYAGAMVNGVYYDKVYNPELIVTNNPLNNVMVIYYLPDGSDGYTDQVESNLNINKTATLENNGTYTITMDTFTKNNPITTLIQQNTPLDIVLVLDQSASMYNLYYPEASALHDLKDAVTNFVDLIADHGRENQVDHRIAMVGFACNGETNGFGSGYPNANSNKYSWCNTGVFDSNGIFHTYKASGEVGFEYTAYTGSIAKGGTYYTLVGNEYLLLTYHDLYRHLITAEEARLAALQGEEVYGYVAGEGNNGYVKLTRNSSGLWLYDGDNKKLYSKSEFFTFHYDVWTHRSGLDAREIHAYGYGAEYTPVDGHTGIFTRKETTVEAGSANSIYKDALVPVTTGANGAGGVTPGLMTAIDSIGANGKTYVSYGMKMANSILAANPVKKEEGRIRFVVVFTDGKPGDSSNFDETESNNALQEAYISEHTYGADVYTVGLYGSDMQALAPESDQAFFMEGLSSNYPNAQTMDDVWASVRYDYPSDGYSLDNGGPYFVLENGVYYPLTRQNDYVGKVDGQYVYDYTWGYQLDNGARVIVDSQRIAPASQVYTAPVIQNHQVNGYDVYRRFGEGYKTAEGSGYYYLAENAGDLRQHFADIVADITTKVTTEIVLHEGTILRDIMNQGLVLTDGTVITAYLQQGNYDAATGDIIWMVDENGNPVLDQKVSLTVGQQLSAKDEDSGIEILVYNYDAANATNPTGKEYKPHTVDVTGYNYNEWYINDTKTQGYKLVVTITRVEARDDVEWGRSTNTNNEVSGLWLPENELGNRELLLPFDQPSTIFVERAYVLDYGKEFTLSGWYFDDEDGKNADPIHLDLDIASGMNWFDESNPNTANTIGNKYGNTKYGNVRIEDGEVIYSPTTMNWGGYDQFYVFGNTWRKTVLAQDANENGNLWNKVTVIPANNVYYEDSFLTMDGGNQNGIEGFVFGEGWEIVTESDGGNTEKPEHQESDPYGNVHGWTDYLDAEGDFTDGSAHGTGLNGDIGATATFTFTGTGADVYTRTNDKSGVVVAILTNAANQQMVKSIAVDNLAVSGDYYHIPTVSFKNLTYGTYTVQLIATSTNVATDYDRYEYYIDGVRIYNPLGSTTNYQDDIVKDAYGLEVNAVFTEVRDILLEYKDFNVDMEDDDQGIMGAVFIDWIQPGQESGNDTAGIGVPTYEIGTFEKYGPKNEVYLSAGQAIVLKVQEDNFYYVGLKSLMGGEVTVNISGIDQAEPTDITLSHTTDMYYRVTPMDGYIVIQNGSEGDEILSITNLRTTNLTAPVDGSGILEVAEQEAIKVMGAFTEYLLNRPTPEIIPVPEKPESIPTVEEQAEANRLLVEALFADVRAWLQAM